MGQNASHHSNHGRLISFNGNNTPPPNYDLPPLKFHSTHGRNIEISTDGFTATRYESFCQGILFSNRPVMISERVCIRLVTMNGRWSGVLRIGFSAHDPSGLSDLPKYACPDLTSKPGYWAKALGERYATEGSVIHYYVSPNGDVHFGMSGKDLGVFFSGIDTRQPLWAMIDLYGNCTTLELIDVRSTLNNFSNNSSNSSTRPVSRNGNAPARPLPPPTVQPQLPLPQLQISSPTPVALPPPQPSVAFNNYQMPVALENNFSGLSLNSSSNSNVLNYDAFPPLCHNRSLTFRSMTFHRNIGRHVKLEMSSTVGHRLFIAEHHAR